MAMYGFNTTERVVDKVTSLFVSTATVNTGKNGEQLDNISNGGGLDCLPPFFVAYFSLYMEEKINSFFTHLCLRLKNNVL